MIRFAHHNTLCYGKYCTSFVCILRDNWRILKMDLRIIVINCLLIVSLVVNIFAVVALLRSRKLSRNIKIFSINLAVTDVMQSVAGGFVNAIGGNITSDVMGDNCLSDLLGKYVILWMYFVSSFLITAMGMDRFVSILFPFRYLEFISHKSERIIRACILFWMFSFGIIVSYDIENDGRLFLCINGKYTERVIFTGLQHSKLMVVGFTNLCILITNIITYSAISIHIWKQRTTHKRRQYSTFGKLLAFTVVYAFLHGPLNLTTIVIGLFGDTTLDYSVLIHTVVVISSVAVVVDPVLYVWRYTDCRIQMMIMLCHCNEAWKDHLKRKQDTLYSSYIINTVPGRSCGMQTKTSSTSTV